MYTLIYCTDIPFEEWLHHDIITMVLLLASGQRKNMDRGDPRIFSDWGAYLVWRAKRADFWLYVRTQVF